MRPEKQLLLDEIKGHIQSSGSFILLRNLTLSANGAHQFRRAMADAGGHVEIVRKRLLVKAAKALGIDIDLKKLEGQVGLVVPLKDPLPTAKALYRYVKDSEGVLAILGGHLDGRICTAEEVQMIAELPNLDEMRAQLLGLFEAPMSQVLSVMDALMCSVPRCLDNKAKLES